MVVSYDHELARLARSGERPDFRLCQVMATQFLIFNCVSDQVNGVPNPFLDRRVRQAFALAVDRQQIVNNVLRRGDRVTTSFVPRDSIPGYSPPDGLAFDPEQARLVLAEAGFPHGDGLPPIEFLYIDRDVQVAQALAHMWHEELGAPIQLRNLETKTFAEAKASQRFMIARGNWYADYTDPTTFLDCLISGNGNNDSGYSNPRYDELLQLAADTREMATRFALLREAESLLVTEDVPIVPILHYAEPIAVKPRISGLYANPRVWVPFKHLMIER
jgi:oligopeptide transport system substrate-binding protein